MKLQKELMGNKWIFLLIGMCIGFIVIFLYLDNVNVVRNEQAADYFEERMQNVNHVVNDNMTIGQAKFLYDNYRFISRYFLEREVNIMCGQNYVNDNQSAIDLALWDKLDETLEQCMRCG